MALVQRFARNVFGRDLIVGDIHGCFTKLKVALDGVGFDPSQGDRLFSVGDLVDRGDESHLSRFWLDMPWFRAVAGNHEDYAIRFPNGFMDPGTYVRHGGGWNVDNPPEVQREFAEAFRAMPIAIEIETEHGLVGVVHADCPCPSWQEFTVALEDPATSKGRRRALIDCAQWSRDRADNLRADGVTGVRAVVVGHQPMRNWTSLGNVIYIDTYGWKDGDFTILDAATLRPAEKPSELWT